MAELNCGKYPFVLETADEVEYSIIGIRFLFNDNVHANFVFSRFWSSSK